MTTVATGKTPTLEGEISPAKDAAMKRAASIRKDLEHAAGTYALAVAAEDWRTLGFDSLGGWRADLFGEHRFTMAARQQVAELLRAGGQTVREIAAATGVSKSQAARDARPPEPKAEPVSLSQNGTSELESKPLLVNVAPLRAPEPVSPAHAAQALHELREQQARQRAEAEQVKGQPVISDADIKSSLAALLWKLGAQVTTACGPGLTAKQAKGQAPLPPLLAVQIDRHRHIDPSTWTATVPAASRNAAKDAAEMLDSVADDCRLLAKVITRALPAAAKRGKR